MHIDEVTNPAIDPLPRYELEGITFAGNEYGEKKADPVVQSLNHISIAHEETFLQGFINAPSLRDLQKCLITEPKRFFISPPFLS